MHAYNGCQSLHPPWSPYTFSPTEIILLRMSSSYFHVLFFFWSQEHLYYYSLFHTMCFGSVLSRWSPPPRSSLPHLPAAHSFLLLSEIKPEQTNKSQQDKKLNQIKLSGKIKRTRSGAGMSQGSIIFQTKYRLELIETDSTIKTCSSSMETNYQRLGKRRRTQIPICPWNYLQSIPAVINRRPVFSKWVSWVYQPHFRARPCAPEQLVNTK